jgi:hypothetical protein
MATFPRREPDIIRLAHDIATGMAANKDLFPSPPSAPDEGLKRIEAYYTARDGSIAKVAGAHDATIGKQKALTDVEDWARGQIHYATSLFRKNTTKLELIGWAGRRATSGSPALPGQVLNLVVQHEGKNSVSLSWRDPVDGGGVAAYKVQRRKTGGDWADVGTAISSDVTLNNQDGAVELEYQVIAVNKTGDGPVSNIVRVVL